MKIIDKSIFCIAMFIFSCSVLAQEISSVVVPSYKDKYSDLVRSLEAGKTEIDFKEFRESFLESEQFKAAGSYNPSLRTLRETVHTLMKESKYKEGISAAKKMLSIDYTDIEAHKILQQTYGILGDAPNKKKYHDIEFGLLKSIVNNGDGKSCQTAWPVIQVTEEYFILNMVDAKITKQSVDNTGGLCDKMEVSTKEGNKTFYFEISNVVNGYANYSNEKSSTVNSVVGGFLSKTDAHYEPPTAKDIQIAKETSTRKDTQVPQEASTAQKNIQAAKIEGGFTHLGKFNDPEFRAAFMDDEIIQSAIKNLMGKDYNKFTSAMSIIEDSSGSVHIIGDSSTGSDGVLRAYGEISDFRNNSAALVVKPSGSVYVAYLKDRDHVLYYTNDKEMMHKLPTEFVEWSYSISEVPIVYVSQAMSATGSSRVVRLPCQKFPRDDDVRRNSVVYGECIRKSEVSVTSINNCYVAELEAQEARLNKAYEDVMTKVLAPRNELLQDAQLAWAKYRDAKCKLKAKPDDVLECLSDTASSRANELEDISAREDGVIGHMYDCNVAEIEFQEADLNKTYEYLMTKVLSPRNELLQDAQLSWAKYRDAHCKFQSKPYGGEIADLIRSDCLISTTSKRYHELQSLSQELLFPGLGSVYRSMSAIYGDIKAD